MKRFPAFVWVWLLSLAVCAAVVTLSFARLDVPLAMHFWRAHRSLSLLGEALAAGVLLSVEAIVILGLIAARLVRGHLSRFAEALAIACLTSICAYGINGDVLKPLFGVPDPLALMQGAAHRFQFLMGSAQSSFPSGHMILAGSFAGVLFRMYRVSIVPLSALLAAAGGLLIVGGWHFLSDVIAGAFLGISAGMLAGEIWVVHLGGGSPAPGRRQIGDAR